MGETLADYRWRWHADDFEVAAAAGTFGADARVELWDGEVLTVPSMLPGHAHAVAVLSRRASRLDPATWWVGTQLPVRLSDLSEPGPDVWIARGGEGTFLRHHPTPAELVLVAEVADTSLALDRAIKIPGYAVAGIAEAWLVSLPERTLTTFREPAGREYRVTATFGAGDEVVHQATGLVVAVTDLMGADEPR
jgi:hypothetical protein